MNYFCTYCDQGYAARMRCLHESLKAQGEPFRLFVLCFDEATERVVAGAKDSSLVAISLAEVLSADPSYAAVQGTRSRVEFFFTSTPVFVRHCLALEPEAPHMTYLDADLFFFARPSRVFAEQGDASVGIVPHRFPRRLAALKRHGTYNVGWVFFRRDPNGLACLDWWRERCLEWCFDRVEGARFADQGYLDEFPRRFAAVQAIEHPGVNAAPWNVHGLSLSQEHGELRIAGRPLIFYHFQGIREVAENWFDPGLGTYHARATRELREWLYLPYLRQLTSMQEELRRDYSIQPARGYLRVPTDKSWNARWQRFRTGQLMTSYRKLRGRLIHCAPREAIA